MHTTLDGQEFERNIKRRKLAEMLRKRADNRLRRKRKSEKKRKRIDKHS